MTGVVIFLIGNLLQITAMYSWAHLTVGRFVAVRSEPYFHAVITVLTSYIVPYRASELVSSPSAFRSTKARSARKVNAKGFPGSDDVMAESKSILTEIRGAVVASYQLAITM